MKGEQDHAKPGMCWEREDQENMSNTWNFLLHDLSIDIVHYKWQLLPSYLIMVSAMNHY